MRKIHFVTCLSLLIFAYLIFWPVPITPGVWTPEPAPALEGKFAPNDKLAALERMGEGDGTAPEDIALDTEGRIYGGMLDGRILRWDAKGKTPETFADTGGRPLGLHFDKAGHLIVADAVKGLLRVAPDGTIETLATETGGLPFGFTDDVEIAEDGVIYFSDASWKFPFTQWMEDLMEHQPNGRLLSFDPKTKECKLLLDGLYFANGVAVDHDQQFVLVVETGKYRVTRYWLKGEKAGTSDVFADNLPGFPDGVSAGSGGVFWLAIASPRDPMLDALMAHPFLRKIALRMPKFLQPSAQHYGMVLGLDKEGNLVENLQDPNGKYAPITSAQEHDGHLYFGSIEEEAFARMKR